MRRLVILVAFFISIHVSSQELNCTLVVNAQQTGNENVQVFKTLEKQLNEFVNNTRWTNKTFKTQERIECSMVITIQDYQSDMFQGSIQVQSARPVHNSFYASSVYNFNDKDFNFKYLEYQNLNFNSTQFESNLVSVIAFHVYMILGMDADTFELNGGDAYYKQARDIVNYSQQNNPVGWQPPSGGDQTRSALISNVLSPTFKEFRTVLFAYHLQGLDLMADNVKEGKSGVATALTQLDALHSRRPNSFLLRVFFDAKADEITDVFSDGPGVNIANLVSTLSKIAPTYSRKWRDIKF
ncbi:DUF4835 family protein [Flavobacteriaceae bacterium]|jgi:hypothetical protein|nr:DUF4835 family protein [Flavobacteriaceae bacterium]MDG1384065.1 DUF4835 family protein [Flavobacteriaceae bacterium]